ncbi:Protein SERAC1 [Tolypocladium ophioglossoides CBS 100239]|uniref:Protein SERAC1 n=1 Tax=Tolypocladium ophioglossoides (strain CBS 100239) TaxID=1163406 RepID=A0A0L0N3L1_TOLOC|nr:Protein SERAC1 [Tolypocladium ophioglossoides CBS 100239]
MASSKKITFRIQNIPAHMDHGSLRDAIRNRAGGGDLQSLDLRGELVPSCHFDGSCTAVVQFFPGTPAFLKGVEDDRLAQTEERLKLENGAVLNIDRNFYGLTPLYTPVSSDEITMDIVAVAGLDGNAFGSWMSQSSDTMWLRDFLKEDLPRCRVLTYGYNAKLMVDMNYTFEDFCNEFLNTLKSARSSDDTMHRPLILMGHSYGARLITKTLVRCKINDIDPTNSAILNSVQAVVFFGAPHRGLQSDMKQFLDERFPPSHPRQRIVNELSPDNEGAERELKDFIDLLPMFFIISIYEQKPTKSLQSSEAPKAASSEATDAPRKEWKRQGPPYIPVERSSSLLNLPLSLEIPIPSEEDHSNVSKFAHKSGTYRVLLNYLKETERGVERKAFPYSQLLYSGARRLQSIRAEVSRTRVAALTPNTRQTLTEHRRETDTTLLGVAISHCEKLQGLVFWSQDQEVLQEALVVLRTAQCLLAAAASPGVGIDSGSSEPRGMLLVVGQYNAALNSITRLLDPFDQDNQISFPINLGHILKPKLLELRRLNELLRADLSHNISSRLPVGSSSQSSTFAQPSVDTMVQMSTTYNRVDKPSISDVLWVPMSSLKFAVGDVQEQQRTSFGWLQRIVESFTRDVAANMKLKPRRYGVLDHKNTLEKVMVEFRPYPPYQDMGVNDTITYEERRLAVARLARMLSCSTSSGPGAAFPSVPLRCLSEIKDSSKPCFLFVYAAEGLYGLDELISRHPAPRPECRLRLALCYARALASLHLADLVHGCINTENLYVKSLTPPEGSSALDAAAEVVDLERCTPLLAGFEVARDLVGKSDRLDVEDPHLRVYLHPDRLAAGEEKSFQHPRHDVFGLGMVLIEIGLWKRFTLCREYPSVSDYDDRDRQRFCRSLRKRFKGEMSGNNMGGLYQAIVAFCLGKDSLREDGDDRGGESWVFWESSRVVELLEDALS